MNMIQMVGIVLFLYFTTLVIICLYRDRINTKIGNSLFIVADIIAMASWTYGSYLTDRIDYGWLTLDNISPLMFTMIPLTPFMSEKVKKCCYSALAFLCAGMFVALIISPSHTYLFSFNLEATFNYASEAVGHAVASLFGIYLVLSGQVKADIKHWLKSMAFLYPIITFGVIANYLMERDYFGMDPYGGYSIYMIDIFGSFEATLVAYYVGVLLVLTIGLQVCQILDKISAKLSPAPGAIKIGQLVTGKKAEAKKNTNEKA